MPASLWSVISRKIVRSRWWNGISSRFQAAPARRFPGLRRQLERQLSLYETLRVAYGIQLAEAEETIETVLADPHDARLLGVDPGLPLLLLSRHAYDVTGEPVEWAQSWYRGDRYKFVTRLRRTPDQ